MTGSAAGPGGQQNNWQIAGAGVTQDIKPMQQMVEYDLKVILKMSSDTQRIAGAPLRYLNDSPS